MNYRDTIGYGNDTPVPKVASNASLEAMLKAMLARGMIAIKGIVTTGDGGTGTFASTDLAGYGDDFFAGSVFYAQIIKTTDSAAPQGEMSVINGYTSSTGTIVGSGLSANIEVGDQVLIVYESLALLGSDLGLTTGVATSANVGANEDGSVLERLEDIKNGAVGSTGIFNEVSSLMTSRVLAGTCTAADATGTENELFAHIPVGIAKPLVVKINLDNLVAGDAVAIKLYYQMSSGGGWVQEDYQSYGGIDGGLTNGNKLITVHLDPNPFGVRITLTQSDGTARSFVWFAAVDE